MPLRSKAQAEYLSKNKPEVFEELKKDTPKGVNLPDRISKKKKKVTTPNLTVLHYTDNIPL